MKKFLHVKKILCVRLETCLAYTADFFEEVKKFIVPAEKLHELTTIILMIEASRRDNNRRAQANKVYIV